MKKKTKKILCAALALCLGIPQISVPSFASASEVTVRKISRTEAAGQQSAADKSKVKKNAGELPEKFDLRDYDYVTSVKNQSPFGTCWSFGVSAAAEISLLTDFGITNSAFKDYYGLELDLSEKHLAYWAYHPVQENDRVNPSQIGEGSVLIKDETASDTYDNGGDSVIASTVYSSGVGPVLENEYPYEFKDDSGNIVTDPKLANTITKDSWSLPADSRMQYNFQLKDGNVLPLPVKKEKTADGTLKYAGYDESATATVKKELYRGRGVCCFYRADQSKPEENSSGIKKSDYFNYTTWGQYDDENLIGNHLVCIVGWDDNFSKDNFTKEAPGDGAWIVKNSWGTGDWGYEGSGYFYLSYYDHSYTALESFDFDTTDRSFDSNGLYIDQYDLMPAYVYYDELNTIGLESSTKPIKMANVYTTKMDEKINSVGVNTLYPNTRVKIELYKFGTSDIVSDPESGEMIDRKVATIDHSGFHRINLNNEYLLRKGEKYSLVVTQQSTDGKELKYYVHSSLGIEKETSENLGYNFYSNAVVNPGESFVNLGEKWEDWSSKRNEYAEGMVVDNFSIKGYGVPVVTDLSKADITLEKTSVNYNGKVQMPVVKSVKENGNDIPSADYSVQIVDSTGAEVKSPKNAGKYKVIITGNEEKLLTGSAETTYTINQAANTIKVAGKTINKAVTFNAAKSKVDKKEQAYKIVRNGKGKISITKKSSAKLNKYISLKNENVVLKKKAPKGKYKFTVTVAANTNWKATTSKVVTINVK